MRPGKAASCIVGPPLAGGLRGGWPTRPGIGPRALGLAWPSWDCPDDRLISLYTINVRPVRFAPCLLCRGSMARPLRLALLKVGGDALAKILAAVDAAHHIVKGKCCSGSGF